MNSTVNNNQEDYVELTANLKLKKNIAELAKILSICYNEYPTLQDEMLDKFLAREITKVVHSLVENPREPPIFPESLKTHLKNILYEENEEI